MTDYKQLCAELVDTLELCDWPYMLKEVIRAEIVRARAALAEPEPEGPSDEELEQWYKDCADETTLGAADHYWAFEVPVDYANDLARAVLARWGRPAPQATVNDCLTDQSTDTQVAQLVRMLGDLAAEAELADQTRDVFVLDRAINMLKRLSLPQPS